MKSIDPEWKSYGSIDEGESSFPADLKYSIKPYRKNEIMFRQGSICDALYILTSGSVKTEMITETGNIMGIELIKAFRPLAPAFLFSDNNRFPVDVTALEDCEILRIPKEEVMRLMAIQPDFMQQFLKHNANRAEFLANRLQLLSIKTIKGRIAHFLLEQMAEYGKTFTINRNRTELAEFFGVARPSLARSLSEMVEDNIIKLNKKQFTVIDERKLKDLLL